MSDGNFDEFYECTSSECDDRAGTLLPSEGSEDATSILGVLRPGVETDDLDGPVEYTPIERLAWVVDVPFPTGKTIRVNELRSIFGESFREEHGDCSLFGRDAATGLWTYALMRDGPTDVTGLKIAYDYFRSRRLDFTLASEVEYAARIAAVTKAVRPILGDVAVCTSKSPAEAAVWAELLSRLHEQYDQHIAFYMVAEQKKLFEGRAIWDAMLSLGLRWGDMDVFHWQNHSPLGDDSHFSVHTSSPPGYFFPEDIADGIVQTEDLVFVFSVPRAHRPDEVARRMKAAVDYCQQRLGGSIRYTLNGQEMSFPALLGAVEETRDKLTELGFEPGTTPAMVLF